MAKPQLITHMHMKYQPNLIISSTPSIIPKLHYSIIHTCFTISLARKLLTSHRNGDQNYYIHQIHYQHTWIQWLNQQSIKINQNSINNQINHQQYEKLMKSTKIKLVLKSRRRSLQNFDLKIKYNEESLSNHQKSWVSLSSSWVSLSKILPKTNYPIQSKN